MFTLKVIISRKGNDVLRFLQNIPSSLYPEMQDKLVEVADNTVDNMREAIVKGKVRPDLGTNYLEKSITRDLISTHPGGVIIGIGNITKMNQEAPYWSMIDAGGIIPPHFVPLGYFEPGNPKPDSESFRQGNWQKAGAGEGGYTFIPRKPIDGIHYISIATQNLLRALDTEVKQFITSELSREANQVKE
jgi:hypothetical protein